MDMDMNVGMNIDMTEIIYMGISIILLIIMPRPPINLAVALVLLNNDAGKLRAEIFFAQR